jgi:hypothetical protein
MTLVDSGQITLEHARNAAYDIVLLAHVLSALVGLGAVAVAGAYALTLRRSGAASDGVRRYYRPGVNWAGRVLFLVPVFGVILVAMSQGDWSYSDTWITVGLFLWVLIVLAAEMALWPEERQLQAAVADPDTANDPASVEALRARCLRVAMLSAGLSAGLVAAAVVMVGKP